MVTSAYFVHLRCCQIPYGANIPQSVLSAVAGHSVWGCCVWRCYEWSGAFGRPCCGVHTAEAIWVARGAYVSLGGFLLSPSSCFPASHVGESGSVLWASVLAFSLDDLVLPTTRISRVPGLTWGTEPGHLGPRLTFVAVPGAFTRISHLRHKLHCPCFTRRRQPRGCNSSKVLCSWGQTPVPAQALDSP